MRIRPYVTLALATTFALSAGATAVASPRPAPTSGHLTGNSVPAPHYKIVDLGTFGGPKADVEGPARQITARGAVLGFADTSIRDEDYPNDGTGSYDGFVHHAFSFRHGRLTDLGALPGNNSSVVFEVNRHGLGVGGSETGRFDRRVHVPATHPVLFHHGTVIDIGILPHGSEGFAFSVNDRGQVVGVSNTGRRGPGMPDFFDWDGQIHSFVWQHGRISDLGTLGGPGTLAGRVNEHGQISGDSYVNDHVNATTGFPTLHPFIWQHGHMRDLGTLGGSQTLSWWINEHGQVVGKATLSGDQVTHPFLWDGRRLRDLGTLGGTFAEANRINDAGVITGGSLTAHDTTFHTFMWRHGMMTDLSPSDDCTFPEWINDHNQIVGGSCDDHATALLWQHATQFDLNSLVGPTDVHLTSATYIDDHGRIVALGTRPHGDQHVFLLDPSQQ